MKHPFPHHGKRKRAPESKARKAKLDERQIQRRQAPFWGDDQCLAEAVAAVLSNRQVVKISALAQEVRGTNGTNGNRMQKINTKGLQQALMQRFKGVRQFLMTRPDIFLLGTGGRVSLQPDAPVKMFPGATVQDRFRAAIDEHYKGPEAPGPLDHLSWAEAVQGDGHGDGAGNADGCGEGGEYGHEDGYEEGGADGDAVRSEDGGACGYADGYGGGADGGVDGGEDGYEDGYGGEPGSSSGLSRPMAVIPGGAAASPQHPPPGRQPNPPLAGHFVAGPPKQTLRELLAAHQPPPTPEWQFAAGQPTATPAGQFKGKGKGIEGWASQNSSGVSDTGAPYRPYLTQQPSGVSRTALGSAGARYRPYQTQKSSGVSRPGVSGWGGGQYQLQHPRGGGW